MNKNIVVTGPTASGKTRLAVALCRSIGGEIISADSRQVYRRMDIGTGKDLSEYSEGGKPVPYHLIDICEAGEKYHVHAYQQDALKAAASIREKGHIPVFCGGTGLYLEAVMEAHQFTGVPVNERLREELRALATDELVKRCQQGESLPFPADTHSRKRLIRAIEIQQYLAGNEPPPSVDGGSFICILVDIPREERRRRISQRLEERLAEGLVDEVRSLLHDLPPDDLVYYGLEYRYVTEYLTGLLTYDELKVKLETEIHRYAKRQMTWFRRMERRGITLHRVNGMATPEEQLKQALKYI